MEQVEMDKVIARVKKLMALAGNNPNENEAAAAADKVQEILLSHNLSMAEITKSDVGDDMVIDGEIVTDGYPWRKQLAHSVGSLYFCTYYYTKIPGYKVIHNFVGERHNIAVAKMMFTYLEQTVDRLARDGAKKLPESEHSNYRTSFRTACTLRLALRIRNRIEAAKRGELGTGTALMVLNLYDQAKNRAQAHMQSKAIAPKTKKLSLHTKHRAGVIDGLAAGDRIGLDGQVGSQVNPANRVPHRR